MWYCPEAAAEVWQFPVLAHQGLFLRRAHERLAGEGVLIEVVGVDVQGPKEFKQYFFLAVRIQGDSMEPYIRHGSIAYVNRDPLASAPG